MSQPRRIRNSESPSGENHPARVSGAQVAGETACDLAAPVSIYDEIAAAQVARRPCALVTLVAATGSVPRDPGAKMLVYPDGRISGTIGGGKFESLVLAEALEVIRDGAPRLRKYPLHEGSADSFGAICGGEVTVFIESICVGEAIWIVGGGHCSQAIAQLAKMCGLYVGVIEDRAELLASEGFATADDRVSDVAAPAFIASRGWTTRDALIIVNRNPLLDKLALAAALRCEAPGYVGMMGSRRKVRRVFDELRAEGHSAESLACVHAPIGLAIGAESPAEIAVSIIAEVLKVCRRTTGEHLKLDSGEPAPDEAATSAD